MHRSLRRTLSPILILVLGLPTLVLGQKRVWMDKNHKKSSEEFGMFYRIIPPKKRVGFPLVDYYKNGKKYREGKSESMEIEKEFFKGLVTYFYPQGSILKKEKYKAGILDGSYKEYYSTGELRVDGIYDKGFKVGIWKIYYKSGKIKTKGRYRKGEKVGEWTTFYRDVY